MALTREKDGRTWRIGTAAEVQWIVDGTTITREITSSTPPVFEAYATLVLPRNLGRETKQRHYCSVVSILDGHAGEQPWWLGYLDTGVSNVIFPDAPMVQLHAAWSYVLIEAGPLQAAGWRSGEFEHRGPLPDLIFPADRSWLFSTLWDDDWSCIGGSHELIANFECDIDLAPRVRRVALGEDATPPGHTSY